MTTFDFDTLIERRRTDSIKWTMYGEDVLPLWVADMDFPAPPAIMEALQARIGHGVFGYALDLTGLRETLCERMQQLYDWKVTPEQIHFLPGVVPGLFASARAFGSPGSGILMQPPIYPPFMGAAPGIGQHNVYAELQPVAENGSRLRYEIDFDALEAAISYTTRLFMLCNPHNPTGRVFTYEELTRLAEICETHDLLICSDEIHCDLLLDGRQHIPIAALSPEAAARTITFMAPSKSFNLAGLFCSFAIVQNPELMTRLQAALQGNVPFVNLLGYHAALAAYQHGQPWLDDLLLYLQGNRDVVSDYVAENLPQLKVTHPEGTYLSWLDCRSLPLNGKTPFEFFLEEAKVALMEGAAFGPGGDGFVRVNFACSRGVLVEALERVREAVNRL